MPSPIVINIQISQSTTTAAAICAVVATLLTFLQVRDHLRLNPNTALKVHVNRVLLMCPVYAWTSFLSTTIGYSIYFDSIRDCYEAFVIYSFFKFMSVVLGGNDAMASLLRSKAQQRHFFPFSCLPAWKMGTHFLLKVQFGILQYVAVKPLMGLVALILGAFGVYREGIIAADAGYAYVSFVINCSQIWAMYCLVIMYLAFADDLKHIRPVPKMLCIKGLIFFTFWQSVLIAFLVSMGVLEGSHENIERFEDLIVCIEMVAFAIAHRWAFPSADFAVGVPWSQITPPMLRSLLSAADVTDVFQDIRTGISSSVSVKVSQQQTDMVASTAAVFVARNPLKYSTPESSPPLPTNS